MSKGALLIDTDRCKACGLCIDVCPQHILHFATSLNRLGYHPVELLTAPTADQAAPAADASRHDAGCTGCALCALVCPDVVITVLREPLPVRAARRPEKVPA